MRGVGGMRLLRRMGGRSEKRAVKKNERVQKSQTTGGNSQYRQEQVRFEDTLIE